MAVDLFDVTFQVVQALEQAGAPCFVGGSLASSLYGIPRTTQDGDVVADLQFGHVAAFVAALEGAFYIDAEGIREAVRERSSFNVIHLGTMLKVDVFVLGKGAFAQQEMRRRQPYVFSEEPRRAFAVASAEDVVLHKLYWYRLGGEVSDRQWRDVLGVMKMRAETLDRVYLERTAGPMGVADLLQRAYAEADL